MHQVLFRALALARRPAVALVLVLLALGGSGLVALPLFGVPGFELGLALALGVGLLGGGVGIAAATQERRILAGASPRPARALPAPSAPRAAGRALLAALALNGATLVPPFLTATVHALASTRCDPLALAGFYPLLTLPSALLASTAGLLVGFLVRRPLLAALAYALLVLASLAPTLWPLYAGPQVYAYNHFLGFLPGPLYDEALELSGRHGWFRLETLLLAALFALGAAALLDAQTGRLGARRLRPGWAALALACAVGVGALEAAAPMLGLRMTDARLARHLEGVRDTEHFRIQYAPGIERERLERTARDLEFRHAQLSAFLGAAPQGRLRVWLYRTDAQKRELVGAGRTQFAKPWRRELHIQDRPFPHPVLKHELAHVMAAPAGRGPFDVSVRAGVWPLMGIIEGLAVAADDPVQGELTLHEWAAGMRRQGLAPDVRRLVGPEGFYQAAPARAYVLAGSFLRHLADTHGPDKLRALYAAGDFEGTYGRPLDALADEWEHFLAGLPLDGGAVARAFARFRAGSLFTRACAREVAALQESAQGFLVTDPHRALELYRRAALLQPEEPGFLMGQVRALEELERPAEAAQVLTLLAERTREQPALGAEVALAQGDVALVRGQTAEARAHFEHALSLAPSPEVTRTAQVKLAALEQPARTAPIAAYFRRAPEEMRLFLLERALQAVPGDAYLHYLLGRRLHSTSAPGLALEHLERALAAELPDAIRREALRLQVESAFLAGDCGAVRHRVGSLPPLGVAFGAQAREWVERCEFEERRFNGPLVPRTAFR